MGKRLFREEIAILIEADAAYVKAYYAEQERQLAKAKEGSQNG